MHLTQIMAGAAHGGAETFFSTLAVALQQDGVETAGRAVDPRRSPGRVLRPEVLPGLRSSDRHHPR